MHALFKQTGANLDIRILASDEGQAFINTHAAALNSSFKKVEMSADMRRRLQRSNYIFSGIKTFHELNEAFPSLLDESGERKPFNRFLQDVQKIDETYNKHYLRAEYNFVHASASMAANWERFAEDGDRYNLQYRTAHDSRVRPKHAALDGITLPISDPFWARYYPPNGWNCRCTVQQVRRAKYPTTPHDEAIARGEDALEEDTGGIFSFNPGMEKKAVPDYNPYTIRRCRDCDVAKGKAKLARYTAENELCQSCRLVHLCQKSNNGGAAERINKYDPKKWERTYISPDDVGFVATQNKRITEAAASNAERQKFEKEMRMCKVLADNGHDVEYLQSANRPKGQTYDITLDGVKADLKCVTGGAGNIQKYAKKALTKQGGEAVVFELPGKSPKYYEALAAARIRYKGRIFFYFAGEHDLKEIK